MGEIALVKGKTGKEGEEIFSLLSFPFFPLAFMKSDPGSKVFKFLEGILNAAGGTVGGNILVEFAGVGTDDVPVDV
ncbi:MAG: hypothetical protein LBC11_00555 [Puniceicoccales bacterium]|jgi:hypothetical protein|nr:hypothetical protein [Puniceicoccales bacterium]